MSTKDVNGMFVKINYLLYNLLRPLMLALTISLLGLGSCSEQPEGAVVLKVFPTSMVYDTLMVEKNVIAIDAVGLWSAKESHSELRFEPKSGYGKGEIRLLAAPMGQSSLVITMGASEVKVIVTRLNSGGDSDNPNPDDPDPDNPNPDNPNPDDPDPDNPNPDDPGPGGVYRAGWPELPIETINSDYHYAHHICPDFTVGGQKARNFTVCFSAENHCPLWVAAPRHACYQVKGTDRTDAYKRDPVISSMIQYSSKSTGGGCNKGHMLGSAERLVTRKTNEQVFYYSNIAPQLMSNFNTGGGAWNNLEGFVDAQVCADTTYVVIGAYFKPFTDAYGKNCTAQKIEFGGRTDVNRPSMFYYLLLRTKSGSTRKSVKDCSANELQCAAFVLRHNMEKGHKPQAQDMMTVEQLEQLTGFTFFANVPQAPKDKAIASEWGL